MGKASRLIVTLLRGDEGTPTHKDELKQILVLTGRYRNEKETTKCITTVRHSVSF
jgi:hypothetical protein